MNTSTRAHLIDATLMRSTLTHHLLTLDWASNNGSSNPTWTVDATKCLIFCGDEGPISGGMVRLPLLTSVGPAVTIPDDCSVCQMHEVSVRCLKGLCRMLDAQLSRTLARAAEHGAIRIGDHGKVGHLIMLEDAMVQVRQGGPGTWVVFAQQTSGFYIRADADVPGSTIVWPK